MTRRHVAALALLLAAVGTAHAREAAESPALNQRLASLQSNPELMELAPYERLQAQQAIAALEQARRRDHDTALFVAQRRVEIAEIAARTGLAQKRLHELERTRGDLLVEASRRDAERARQEAERMRIQAQIQAEEAERLRQAAEAEAEARQGVEETLTTVTGQQSARLNAARQRDAKLAREEAELVSGAKLPASRFDSKGEVFTLPASSFARGSTKLSTGGKSTVSALAAYLQAMPKAKARITGYSDGAASAQGRGSSLRDALVAAGIDKSRLQAGGSGKATDKRAAEVVVE